MATTTLTAKQARFVDEYLVDGNGAAAAVRAGYAPGSAKVTACQLLTQHNLVKAAVKARQDADSARLGVTREKVLGQLLEAFEMAKVMAEPAAMVRAAAELGRMMGFYEPVRVAATVDVGSQAEMDRMATMTDAELMEIVAQGTAA